MVATRNWPGGSSAGLDAAAIAAGVTAESACPDGPSSASLLVHPGPGAMKTSPAASRPSYPPPAKVADSAFPLVPKLASSVPFGLYRRTDCSKKLLWPR